MTEPTTPTAPTADLSTLVVAAAVKSMVGPAAEFDGDKLDYNAAMVNACNEIVEAAGSYGVVGEYLDRLAQCKHFTAEIVSVAKEQSTQRIKVELRTDRIDKRTGKPMEEHPVRTNRLDDFRYGSSARSLGRYARSLIGHKVLLTVRNEQMANRSGGQTSRVVEAIRDLGAADDED